VGFEIGKKSWVLALSAGFGVAPWVQAMLPGDWRKLQQVLAKARTRFGLAADARVVSYYEGAKETKTARRPSISTFGTLQWASSLAQNASDAALCEDRHVEVEDEALRQVEQPDVRDDLCREGW
jgi:hypothetical protein